MSKIQRRKDHNGRVLPEGVSERADGRYIYRYQQYGKTHYLYSKDLTELKRKIEQLKLDVVKGRNLDLSTLSLNQWYPQYLEIYKRGKIKETSMVNKENYYKWYIEPYDVGRMPLQNLKRIQLVAHFQYLADKKELSHGTLRTLASMLYTCIEQVVLDCGLFVNPATDIMKDVVATPKEVRKALTHEQVDTLVAFLKEEGFQNVYLPMIGILLGTGMRFGECNGLTWKDVDLENRVIHIDKTINYRVKRKGGKHTYFYTSPKTPNAVRDICMSDDVYRLFQMQQQYQKDMRIRKDIKIPLVDNNDTILRYYNDFVFTTRLGNPFTHEGFVSSLRRIINICNEKEAEKAEKEKRDPIVISEKVTPHVFRHTFCTFIIEDMILHDKRDYDKVKVLMGHSSIKTSIDVYTTINEQIKKQSWEEVGNIMNIF